MWYGENSFIGGGEFNHDSSNVSVIAGGDSNRLIGGSDYAAIGGGQDNVITGAGNHADIPGGDSLVAQSFAQTVLGFHNLPAGGFVQGSSSSFATNPAHANDPILIVGSGTKTSPSNALQVSYDGHTSVFDVNNNSTLGGRKAILGSTYQDNVLYAWGDIAGGALAGPPCTGAITEFGDFGVAQFTYVCTGHYRVQLSTEDALGNSITTWSDLSVTATPMTGTPTAASCVIAVLSPVAIGSTTFDIFLFDPGSSCTAVDGRVAFHVFGRQHN